MTIALHHFLSNHISREENSPFQPLNLSYSILLSMLFQEATYVKEKEHAIFYTELRAGP